MVNGLLEKTQNWAIFKEFGAVYLLDNSRIIMWLRGTKEQTLSRINW